MDNLSVLMETVQGNPCGCRAYLERDSLIQRLACGLHRVNAQALEAGFYDRLPSTRNIAILQQEVFKLSRRLHTAEVESHSLHLQLAEFKWTFNEMQKDAEKAHRLQEQLNALQNKIITQDNIRDELDKALQREHEARLLLQEHQQRLQELSDRLELHTRADPDRNQVSKASLMSLHDATEELRRDQVLNHQKSLLKDIEQDRQRLHETLQEAEHALQQAAKDKELMINHMKAVDATLNAIKDQATASGAAAATLLPSLKFETLSEETVSSRPEVIAFQNVLKSFMELYSLASARHEALTTGRESSGVHIKPEAAVTPPAPPSKEPFWRRIGRQLAKTPPAHARDSNESVGPRFVPKGDAAPHDPESNDIFQPRVSPQASVTAPATPAPTLSPKDIFQPHLSPQASSIPASHTPASGESFQLPSVPQGTCTPRGPAPGGSFQLPFVPRGTGTPRGPAPDGSFQLPSVPRGTRTPRGPAPGGSFQLPSVPRGTGTPRGPAPDESFQLPAVPQGTCTPRGPAPGGSFQLPFVPRGTGTPRGPAPDAHRGEPRQRTYILSGPDTTPGVSSYRTYIFSGSPGVSTYKTYTVTGTNTTPGSFRLPSVPQGTRTPRGPAPDAHRGEPRKRTYILSGPDTTPGVPPYRTYIFSGTPGSFWLPFVPQGTCTPRGPAPDESLQVHFELEAATSPPAPAAAPASPHDDSFRRHIEPEAYSTHPAPAPDDSFWLPVLPQAARPPPAHAHDEPFWCRIGHHLAKTPPAHARDSNESVGPRFVPKGAAALHDPESHDIFQPRVSPQASVTAPATPAPTLSPAAQWREPRHRHFSCAPESQLDQNYGQDFWLLQPETDLSSDVICHSTHTVSGSNTTAGVRPDRNYTLSASNIPSSVVTGRNYSMSETNIPSSVTPGRTGFGSSMDISSHVIPGRNYSMSGINIPSIVTPGSTGFGSSMDISSHMRPIRTYSTSETNIPSSVTPGSTGFGSSMDISSHMRPIRTYSMSETNIPSSVTPGSTSFGSSMDISSHMRPIRTYRVSSANTSNVTPSRRGIGSSLDTFINLIPTTTDTGSSMDASSRMTQSRTFTVSSVNMPSRLTENRTGTGSSVNTSFHFRPHRTSSLPSVRSSSQDESSTRRNQGI
ncbi:mucin-12-like isoform X4 [Cyanistes caeruleus]|uniref:mucin-12-like isoform X3 n=1 Tax=Cyanistes caeruleus TaxID=156563 RepID=UPI000CDA5A2B|nr:mucin-12-like isoform X3 [Cyanistes caeruleus]XP_023799614.1 mucin-12-like isoform X4 [Cyanistes caeruleus]